MSKLRQSEPESGSRVLLDLCVDEASFVRLYRARKAEGRDREPDVRNGLEIQLVMILSGGYPKRARRFPDAVRAAVIARDQGRCRRCGQPGSDVDHIAGGNNDPQNLQYLCRKCHDEKTRSRFTKISPETHPEKWAKRQAILERVHAPKPLRLCDGTDWDKYWPVIQRVKKDGPQQSLFF